MKMKTFGELRDFVLAKAGVKDHFAFLMLSPQHREFWDEMNRVEYERGYNSTEYLLPDTLALWEMELLTEEEFNSWIQRFNGLNNRV